MGDIADIVKSIEIASGSFQQQIEIINKTMKPIQKVINKMLEVTSGIAKFFEKTIYLSSDTYEFFLNLRISISPKEIRKGLKEGTLTEEDIYTIYTIQEGATKFKTISFKVTKEVAEAIKVVIKNKPQFMFLETNNVVFEEEKPRLVINGFPLALKKGTPRYDLCKFMFGGKRRKKMPWELEDLVKAIGEDYSDASKDWYHIVYEKYRALNHTIEEGIGYKDFFISNNTMFTVNPAYISFLRK